MRKIPFGNVGIAGIVLGSVVPKMTKRVQSLLPMRPLMVSADIDLGVGIRYPEQKTDPGADRLANAVAVAESLWHAGDCGRFRHGGKLSIL